MGTARQDHEGVDVDCSAYRLGGRAEKALEIGVLRCLHQTEMPVRKGQPCIAAQAAEHRQTRLRGRFDEQLRVPIAPHAVVDDRGDVDVGPKPREPVDHGGGGGRHGARVDHQHHRPPGERRDVGRRAFVRGRTVVETHHPFGDHELRIRRRRPDRGRERRVAHRPRVEVEAGASARRGVEGGVDVVRSDLERSDPNACIPQVAQQGERHRGLSAAGRRGGNHDTAGHGPMLLSACARPPPAPEYCTESPARLGENRWRRVRSLSAPQPCPAHGSGRDRRGSQAG